MKKFSRSTAGKVTLFIVCVLLFCIFSACVMGAGIMLQPDEFNFYNHTEAEIKTEIFWNLNRHPDMVPLGADEISSLINFAYSMRYAVYVIGIVSFILGVASFVALLCAAGHRPDTEEVFPGLIDKVPYDLVFVFCIGVLAGFVALMDGLVYSELLLFVCAVTFGIILICIFIGLSMDLAGRIKVHSLIKNTIIYRVLALCWKAVLWIWGGIKKFIHIMVTIIKNIPIVWKTAVVSAAILIFNCVAFFEYPFPNEGVQFFFVLIEFAVALFAIYVAICLRKLQKGGKALADGDLSYITDTKGLFLDFKQHGENLNSIAVGMGIAIEDRLKSERMKTELITNVSHDLKTPLTSIINYASLIGNEECDNEKITEYSEVLVRQSDKLKRLIEDLVEASKASTGNLEVNLAQCDAAVFLTQASGEYQDKLSQYDLTLCTKQPERELRIMADGRRMWRIFDNLMNNICKYSLPGTRVYLSLEELDNKAVFTFKNTSKEALDITEDELMERFIRGDSSRNTEGNGLGLSIAKSMAELQNGDLKLSIDGDLFKAILSFPIV